MQKPPKLSTQQRREIAKDRRRDEKGHFVKNLLGKQTNDNTNYLKAQMLNTKIPRGALGPAAMAVIAGVAYNYVAGRVRLKRLGLKSSASLGQVRKSAAEFNKRIDEQSKSKGWVSGALYRTTKHVWVK